MHWIPVASAGPGQGLHPPRLAPEDMAHPLPLPGGGPCAGGAPHPSGPVCLLDHPYSFLTVGCCPPEKLPGVL